MRIVLLGPPGAGKGTQAQYLAKNLSVPHISTGDLFRANISRSTPLGLEAKRYIQAGDLVPDEVTIGMVKDRLHRSDAGDGFLLDGFPRNLEQARVLDGLLAESGHSLDAALELVVPKEEVVRRLAGRRTCSQDTSHTFHVLFCPPEAEGVCDVCGGELYQRDDDREETVRHRLDVYQEQTTPLIGYYSERDLLVEMSALGRVSEVTERAMALLEEKAGDTAQT